MDEVSEFPPPTIARWVQRRTVSLDRLVAELRGEADKIAGGKRCSVTDCPKLGTVQQAFISPTPTANTFDLCSVPVCDDHYGLNDLLHEPLLSMGEVSG